MLLFCSSVRVFEDKIDTPTSPSGRFSSLRVPTFQLTKRRKVNKAIIGTPTGFVHFQHIDSGSCQLNETNLRAIDTVEWKTLVTRKLSDASQSSAESNPRRLGLRLITDISAPSSGASHIPLSPVAVSPASPTTPASTGARRRSTLLTRKPVPAYVDETTTATAPTSPIVMESI
ncbi:uncharacterized protein EI90DRAFT_554944 [Cantharellus anzutake]|uniref:uncharacterized protein n=1 Tax=Cantharellus anzutake TaxID=1750568 RepID=UPI0019080EC4|nr:uncharacterized protein EI90DRAFT_554944 [Cantharellus anzutake]KAF8313516.1 hypothetical protein EI90DRAFT_554944 [Cantharellus anzutake]